MKKIYFTITGTKYIYGHDFMKPGMKVKLEKDKLEVYKKQYQTILDRIAVLNG